MPVNTSVEPCFAACLPCLPCFAACFKHFVVFSVSSMLCSMLQALCRFSVSSMLCSMLQALCSVSSMLCSMLQALCSVSSMLCSMLQALCSVSSMLCSMPSMLCSMLATLCSMPSTLCSILTIKLINLRFTDNVCLFDLHTWCVYIICLKYIIHSDTWNFATCLRHSHRPWIQVTIPLLCSTPPLQHLCTVP